MSRSLLASLVLGGGNLGASANLNVSCGATVIFQSTSTTPAIGSLEVVGSVVLGSSGAAVTLTVGGNNASTLFAGTISENDIGGSAGLHQDRQRHDDPGGCRTAIPAQRRSTAA